MTSTKEKGNSLLLLSKVKTDSETDEAINSLKNKNKAK